MPTFNQQRAHRPRVCGDHFTILPPERAHRGVGVPLADRHEVLAHDDVREPARLREKLRDVRRDGLNTAPLPQRIANGSKERVRARGVRRDVAAVRERRPPPPLARHEQPAAAQEARYLRKKRPIVADLRSTRVRQRATKVGGTKELSESRMSGDAIIAEEKDGTSLMLAIPKRRHGSEQNSQTK